ncbi:hypothetical protein ID11_19225 (plasmid) [Pantoea vagans]|nr:hypothetical protein ID11_19225 [Pantoea vagans]
MTGRTLQYLSNIDSTSFFGRQAQQAILLPGQRGKFGQPGWPSAKLNTSQPGLFGSLHFLYYILDSWRDIFSQKVNILIMT